MDDDDDPFTISGGVETSLGVAEAQHATAAGNAIDPAISGRQQQGLGSEDDQDVYVGDDPEGAGAASGPTVDQGPEGLIPLCIRRPDGPQLDPRVYGYDIMQLEDKPWAKPGANVADYFNYGFDEDSWRLYCAMHPRGPAELKGEVQTLVNRIAGRGGMGGPGGPPPSFPGRGGMVRDGPPREHGVMYKTKLCYAFRDGNCLKGDNCPFAHGEAELRTPPPFAFSRGGGSGGFPPPAGGGMMGPGFGGRGSGGGPGRMAPPPPFNPVMSGGFFPMHLQQPTGGPSSLLPLPSSTVGYDGAGDSGAQQQLPPQQQQQQGAGGATGFRMLTVATQQPQDGARHDEIYDEAPDGKRRKIDSAY